MSPWRPERACASLTAARASLLVRRGRASEAVGALPVDAPMDEGAALQAMGRLLQSRPGAARELSVVVSDQFARYFAFEPVAGLRSLAELRMLLATLFEQRFGERADAWSIEFDLGLGARAGLACALPRAIVQGMRDIAHQAGFTRISLRPFFVAALGDTAPRLADDTWIAARADGQVTLARISGGRWLAVRTMASSDDDSVEALVAREQLRLGWDESARGLPALAVGAWPGAQEAEFDMALTGATA